jgi:hypothetical protein
MPHSSNHLTTAHTCEQAFDFISDFRHAALWDPRTQSVTKLSDGPIGRGTRFMLQGSFLGQPLELPYTIEVYERPTLLVLRGRTSWCEYREQAAFRSDGGGANIDYDAELSLLGLLALGNPIVSLFYQRVANDATSGIVPALDRSLASPVPA